MSKVDTFFLSKNVPKFVEKLSRLKAEWERDIASALLDSTMDEEEKIAKIKTMLPANRANEEKEAKNLMVENVIEMLPKTIRARARILAGHLMKSSANIGDGDVVLLPDFGPTAPLIDVLKFYASPRHLKVPLPQEASKLSQYFIDNKFPMSAFGSGVLDSMNSPSSSSSSRNESDQGTKWISI